MGTHRTPRGDLTASGVAGDVRGYIGFRLSNRNSAREMTEGHEGSFPGLAGVAGTSKRECHRVRILHTLLANDPSSATTTARSEHGVPSSTH